MTAKLIVRGLSAGYGAIRVLEAIDLEVPAGKLTVIIGPNGAGKTTLRFQRSPPPSSRAAWRWCRRGGSCFHR